MAVARSSAVAGSITLGRRRGLTGSVHHTEFGVSVGVSPRRRCQPCQLRPVDGDRH